MGGGEGGAGGVGVGEVGGGGPVPAKVEWELAYLNEMREAMSKAREKVMRAEEVEELAKEAMAAAERAEDAAKNVVCERVVRAQQVEKAAAAAQAEQAAQEEQKECCICYNRTELRLLYPCGHRCVCAGCGDKLVEKPCPMCRKNVREVMRVFE
jgi:hypothetical protein